MILIDTTPLVALCDPRDSKHQTALDDLEGLAEDEFTVCEAVLTETCFHLPHRIQRLRLRAMLEALDIQPVHLSDERGSWVDALDWLVKYAEHEPDWADACLAVLSGRDRRARVWTYDREFRTTWRRQNGTVIPVVPSSSRAR